MGLNAVAGGVCERRGTLKGAVGGLWGLSGYLEKEGGGVRDCCRSNEAAGGNNADEETGKKCSCILEDSPEDLESWLWREGGTVSEYTELLFDHAEDLGSFMMGSLVGARCESGFSATRYG